MKLEELSWIAGVVAVPVALLTWLVKPKEFRKFLKSFRWLFVLSGLVWLVIWTWCRGWFHWLSYPVSVPIWALFIFGLGGLALLILFGLTRCSRGVGNDTTATPSTPQPLDWHDFVSDKIFGVDWHWSYFCDRFDNASLTAHCPQIGCMNRLRDEIDPSNPTFQNIRMGPPPTTMKCERCGFIHHFDCDHDTLHRRVVDEIERLIQTGQFAAKMRQTSS